LIANDIGIRTAGLLTLVRELRRHSHKYDIRVIAPESEQSGVSHSITLYRKIEAEYYKLDGDDLADIKAVKVNGTPADCVKLGLSSNLFEGFIPDLVISGINRGNNVGFNIIYSGTVGAAQEACVNDFPAIALSLNHTADGFWHFVNAAEYSVAIIDKVLSGGLPKNMLLNVNFPNCSDPYKGVKLTKMGRSFFQEYYVEEPNPGSSKKKIFKLEGTMNIRDTDIIYDAKAMADGYVSVTPLALDYTESSYWDSIAKWDMFEK